MRRTMLTLLMLVVSGFVFLKAGYADSNTRPTSFPYYAVIQEQIKAINESGHPIFITGCKQDSSRYIVVIPNPLDQGFLAILNGDDVIDMASINESAVRHAFYVEANGGGERNAEMGAIVKKLSKLPFHLIDSLSYKELMGYTPKVACDLPRNSQQ